MVGFFESVLNIEQSWPGSCCSCGKEDFIEFWTEKLDETTEYLIYPQETKIIDAVMPVDVTPVPANAYRIWFYFIPDDGTLILEPDSVEEIDRQGYTLVEWGGMYE